MTAHSNNVRVCFQCHLDFPVLSTPTHIFYLWQSDENRAFESLITWCFEWESNPRRPCAVESSATESLACKVNPQWNQKFERVREISHLVVYQIVNILTIFMGKFNFVQFLPTPDLLSNQEFFSKWGQTLTSHLLFIQPHATLFVYFGQCWGGVN